MHSGPTRSETDLSEARSYANLASENNYFGLPNISSARLLLEERALDSYQNILFSLTLFFSTYRTWPRSMTIVSHAFKKHRLVDLHCSAIGFPGRDVEFMGIDPPGEDGGEGSKKAEVDWTVDPHGIGGGLRAKREKRNVKNIWQGVFREGEGSDSGLVTNGSGSQEHLVDDAPRPWN